MARRKISVENAGTDALRVRLLGDRTQPEPSTFLVTVPGGEIEIARTTDGSYWVHVRPWTDLEAKESDGERKAGELTCARVDYRQPGGVITDGEEVGFGPTAGKIAVLLSQVGQ